VIEFLRRSRIRVRARAMRKRAYRTARRATKPLRRTLRSANKILRRVPRPRPGRALMLRLGGGVLLLVVLAGGGWGIWRLASLLVQLDGPAWGELGSAAGMTFVRVLAAVALSTAWALPVGVLIGRSPGMSRALQPVIQIVASFPAPMIFPIVVLALANVGLGLGLGSVVLMILSAQWYILFNVISAVAALPPQLAEAAQVFKVTGMRRWRTLYLPAAFPALVTGWVTAAGGAWNASIVSEYIQAGGATRTTAGLGSLISVATAQANFPMLAGGITVMSLIVVGWNRLVWRRLAIQAQNRFGVTQ
jgi:NitT/TauT family transport system permease protein